MSYEPESLLLIHIAHTHNDFINTHALLIVTHFSSSIYNVCQHITLTSVGGGQGMEKQLVSSPKQVHNDNNELNAVSPTISTSKMTKKPASSQQNTAKTNETNQRYDTSELEISQKIVCPVFVGSKSIDVDKNTFRSPDSQFKIHSGRMR